MDQFQLDKKFVEKYATKQANFGFNGLGEITYYRTYSRLKENGENEKWFETVERVVNGIYSIQKKHILEQDLGWSEVKAQQSAEEMYERMFTFKFLPPGRGLWACGTDIIKKGLGAAMNNCGFVSTEGIDKHFSKPFTFMMDMSMLGVGIGFDVKGAGRLTINKPLGDYITYQIPDTREGWVDSLKLLLESYIIDDVANKYSTNHKPQVMFDYSLVRKAGEPIKTFGGVSSGPGPLKDLHKRLKKLLEKRDGKTLTATDIADMMNLIGVCVVSGNVRRSAQIMFGEPDSVEYLDLKNYEVNPSRAEFGWTSNNSVICNEKTNYTEAAKRTAVNGEPGYFWLENAQNYGRMCEAPNYKDRKVVGCNPCAEQSLENFELCCLVETFPANHESKEDYLRTLKFAYLYAKSVTLLKTHNKDTNKVLLRNRRIGLSQTGIAQFLETHSLEEYRQWCNAGYMTVQVYDEIYSNWLCIPKSIKTTSIKPSGTISLLAGATPGMHYPERDFYIRRVRIGNSSPLLEACRQAGYKVEQDVKDGNVSCVEIPVAINCRTVDKVSIWEQVELAAFIQKWWADNQVSCTVTFKPEEAKDIPNILKYHQYDLKAISFLPVTEKGAYDQMPYEAISKETYDKLVKNLKPLVIEHISQDSKPELYCDADKCELK
jgi:adenosylcobalamin-dependent ribonucleoside-triphosphate reductase